MKFLRLFILKISPDAIIHESAEDYRDWFQVPANRRWSNAGGDGWGKLDDGCFGECGETPTLEDKMLIFAHGTTTYIGGDTRAEQFDAIELVDAMQRWGVDAVGLISFKCCNVGKGKFLDHFVGYAARKGLQVGWVKGYKGGARTLRKIPFVGKPTELITQPTKFFEGTAFEVDIPIPLTGADRFKILPGTKPFTVPNARYFLESGDK